VNAVREDWRKPDYWLWLWRARVPFEAKIAAGAVGLVALLGIGWLAADRLTAAKASTSTDALVLETTVSKLITVREKGRLITKRVPVIRRIVRSETATANVTQLRYRTNVVTTPGKTRTVSRLVTTVVPVVKTRVIKVNGKTRTVVETNLLTTTRTETQVQTQTRQQTVTNNVTQPPSTVTQSQTSTQTRTVTTTQTQTVTTTNTVTLPAETVTVTGPTQTVTITETVTVTTPGETITITVPGP
jgi:hypothetical protein